MYAKAVIVALERLQTAQDEVDRLEAEAPLRAEHVVPGRRPPTMGREHAGLLQRLRLAYEARDAAEDAYYQACHRYHRFAA